MSKWTQKYLQHPINNTLKSIESLLPTLNLEALKSPVDAFEDVERIMQVVELTKSRIEHGDPNLIPPLVLGNLNTSLQGMINELNAFKINRNVGHLTNANSNADNLLIQLANLIEPYPIDILAINEAASSYRRSVGQLLRSIDEERGSIQGKLKTLETDISKFSTEIDTQKKRIDAIINNSQLQFTTSEDKRRSEFQAAEEVRKKTSEKQSSQKESEWNQMLMGIEAESEELLKNTKDVLTKLQSESSSNVKDIIDQMIQSKKEAQDLVGIITDTGMVGGYQRVANEEKKSARNWRLVAVGALTALVLFAIYAFYETLNNTIRFDQITLRIFVMMSFGILAAYAALQADKHEKTERRNRKIELELASIVPFLHDLPLEKQFKIREEMAMRMFGQAEAVVETSDKKTTGSMIDVLKLAIETISNLTKK